MKLTPEQKAFLEYGKAIAALEYRIERIRFTARMLFKKEYRELSLRFRGGLRDGFQLYYAIGGVRRKRAGCKKVESSRRKSVRELQARRNGRRRPLFFLLFPVPREP